MARSWWSEATRKAALSFLELLASTRPLDEHLHRVLIEALAGLGRRWEAIESYERLRDALEEEYAAELEPETKVLYRRLLSGNKPMPASTPHNLPESTTSFVGRQRLLTELTAGLVRTRLLALTGVGGVGKSRLASHTFRTGCPHCRSRRRHRVNAMAAHAQF